jgi:signal transduction histidine kinase
MMMLLVLFGLAFLWIVEIMLFESNYMSAAMEELEQRVEEVAQEFNESSMRGTANPMAYLSRTVSGKVFLLDSRNVILFAYGGGLPSEVGFGTAEKHAAHIKKELMYVISGHVTRKIDKNEMMLSLGYPLTYRDHPAALFIYDTLTEIKTMQEMNRRQLFALSFAMTAVASLLAFFLTRQFTKPILKIKNTVDRLAEGDLSATPRIARMDELGKLSRSVEELGQALKRLDILRKEVIANVSHELRAPLSLIIGYGEMVRDITWKDASKREENLGLIIREANRLSQMVDDIMDYSQLQAGYAKLNKAPCNLYELVEQEIDLERRMADGHGIIIRFESFSEDVPVNIDSLKISQALRNLMNNAINHTSGGESIDVSITLGQSGAKVSVANPGEPIPESERELIWERYHRVQHQGARKEGTGIGLAIVSTILSAHGMPYGVDYEKGKNVFWFISRLV